MGKLQAHLRERLIHIHSHLKDGELSGPPEGNTGLQTHLKEEQSKKSWCSPGHCIYHIISTYVTHMAYTSLY
jgi:hypothetical protein